MLNFTGKKHTFKLLRYYHLKEYQNPKTFHITLLVGWKRKTPPGITGRGLNCQYALWKAQALWGGQ